MIIENQLKRHRKGSAMFIYLFFILFIYLFIYFVNKLKRGMPNSE